MARQHDEFPETFLPDVARAADRALDEVLQGEEDAMIQEFLEIPAGLHPRRAIKRRRS